MQRGAFEVHHLLVAEREEQGLPADASDCSRIDSPPRGYSLRGLAPECRCIDSHLVGAKLRWMQQVGSDLPKSDSKRKGDLICAIQHTVQANNDLSPHSVL